MSADDRREGSVYSSVLDWPLVLTPWPWFWRSERVDLCPAHARTQRMAVLLFWAVMLSGPVALVLSVTIDGWVGVGLGTGSVAGSIGMTVHGVKTGPDGGQIYLVAAFACALAGLSALMFGIVLVL